MTQKTLSQATMNDAHALALTGHAWHKGRSKENGRPFYLIPSSSTPNTAHRTTNYGCTCTGYLRRGDCKHVEAVRMFEAREATAPPAEQSPLSKYQDLFRSCVAGGCDDDRVKGERYCSRHALIDSF